VTQPPRGYTERCDLIAEKLEPYLHVSALTRTNTEPAFDTASRLFTNSLKCSWADPETLTSRTLSVYVDEAPDGEKEAEGIHSMMADEAPREWDRSGLDAAAYEVDLSAPGAYAFVLNYLGSLTVIVGNCRVEIMPTPVTIPLAELEDAALDIVRTVGCSAYVDDFQPPTIDASRSYGYWTTANGLIYDPRTPPQP